MNMEGYLANHDNRPIGNGRSGAEIWEIEEKYVLKHIRKENLPDAGAFPLYCNEAYFYRFWGQQAGGAPSFLPKVLEVQATDDEIFILMNRYQELSRAEADDRLLRKVMGTLAMIHTQDIPAFLRQEQRPPEYLAREQIESCLAGWRSVLAEHPGAFDERILADTAADINELIGQVPLRFCNSSYTLSEYRLLRRAVLFISCSGFTNIAFFMESKTFIL